MIQIKLNSPFLRRMVTLFFVFMCLAIECAAQWNVCLNPNLGIGQGARRRLDLTFIPEQNWSAIPINTEFYFNYRENDTANFNLKNIEERTFFYSMID